jgi:uncharacterized protein (DUF58 family)
MVFHRSKPARYPDMIIQARSVADVQAAVLYAADNGLQLATRSGGHLSRFRGRGMEFDESRVYQPGDDPRNMDWRVTARSSVPHVKLFREERERPVWLLVDMGPWMRFGTRVAFKSVIAARAAALLAWAAADKGDRVGGLVFDESAHLECRPAARSRALLPLLKSLSESPLSGRPGGYGYLSAARHLMSLVRPGSLVFLLSDFAGFGQHDGDWMARLASTSELVLVHIYDALEAVAPPAGLYPVSDGIDQSVFDTGNAALRQIWSQRFAEHVETLEAMCSRYRAHLISLRTDQAVGPTLSLELQPRGVRAGGIR